MRGEKSFSVEALPTSGFLHQRLDWFQDSKEACQAFLQINSCYSAFSKVQLQALELCTDRKKQKNIS